MHWGVREHGMAAAMNGMALHGGLIPYGGTFLVFSDYCRPSIRLAALMGNRVIFVMTHDSIGLGEDGPTHQPVEQVAALRAIPNLLVFRPADAVETLECWQLALESRSAPSLLALTRQNLPLLRTEFVDDNACARGAYEIAAAEGDAEVTLFATGSEVEIALAAKALIDAGRPPGARRLGALFRALRGGERGLQGRDHRRCAGQGRHRGGRARGLGPLHRPRRHLRRHAWIWRQRALRRAVQEVRDHRRGGRRSGFDQGQGDRLIIVFCHRGAPPEMRGRMH